MKHGMKFGLASVLMAVLCTAARAADDRAICLNEKVRVDRRLAACERAAATNPNDLAPVMLLGNTLREGKQFTRCVEVYSKGIAAIGQPNKDHWPIFYFRAICYERSEQLAKAETDLEQALALNPEQPEVMNYLGYIWIDRGLNFDRALALIKRALELAPGEAFILDSLGWAYYRAGQFEDAVKTLERAVALPHDDPTIDDHLGDAYDKVGRKREALARWRRAVELKPEPTELKKISEKIKLAGGDAAPAAASRASGNIDAMQRQFQKYYDEGQFELALEEARRIEALVLARFGERSFRYTTVLHSIGNSLEGLGRSREAEPYYKRAWAIDEQLRDTEAVVRDLNNLADNYARQGRQAEAEAHFKLAIAIGEKAHGPNHSSLILPLNNLAVFYTRQTRFAEAEALLKRTMPLVARSDGTSSWEYATTLDNIGVAYIGQGRYAEAEKALRQALAIDMKLYGANNWQTGKDLHLLAQTYQGMERFEEAEDLYKRSAAIYERTFGATFPDVAELRSRLANLYRLRGRYAEAEVIYKTGLPNLEAHWGPTHPLTVESLHNLAVTYRLSNDVENALTYARRATRALVASAEVAAGAAQPPQATPGLTTQRIDYFRNHLAIVAAAARKGGELSAELAREGFEVAQWASQSSAAAAVEQMGLRFAAGDNALAALVRESQDLAATHRANDAALTAVLGKSAGERKEPAVAALRRQMAETESKLTAIASELEQKFPDYVALARPQPLKADEVQKLLTTGEALVLFLPGDSESYVFAFTTQNFDWKTIPLGRNALSQKVAAFRRGLDVEMLYRASGGIELFDLDAAHALFVELLGPVDPLIRDKPSLLVVPDGPLTALPFHLLVTQQPSQTAPSTSDKLTPADAARYRDAAWLIKRQVVSVLPSVASLKALRAFTRSDTRPKAMIGFGDPVFGPEPTTTVAQRAPERRKVATRGYADYWQGAGVDRTKLSQALPRLPDTADELKAVAQTLGESASDIYLRREASERQVKRAPLADYRIVYFATHGLVAGDVKGLAEPSLALTIPTQPSDLDDGLLTASEVAQLKLNADWVVLSACNTIAGDKPGAEALSGLARAFFYAGARALLVSHWAVDSAAATRIAISTFDALKNNPKLGRANALRGAMLSYLSDASEPRNAYPAYWGAFSIIGEGAADVAVPSGSNR